ncbi:MAG TPA: mannose/fructose/sorbose PTS transporter subunit IIA [Pseudogracilibacillus sp.]|nr:mannose/fructose/sorbose PTS transporter subunit IIA [Pseudogracilibacillus sp.]
MVGIILASHGEFAEGILHSSTMIFGEQDNMKAVSITPSEGPDELQEKLKDAVSTLDNQDEVLFLVDLWGGTPFNQTNLLWEENKEKWAVVSGLNLPMLIEALASRLSMDSAHQIAKSIITTAKDGIKGMPETLEPETSNSDADTANEAAANVGAPGKMEYPLARIDSRLLHGQVATSWTREANPTRIIVASDSVAEDELRTKLIKQAAPSGIKAHVIPIRQLIKIAKDDQHFGGQRALLLFENPQDVLEAIEGGVPLDTINVGSMAHSTGKVQPNRTLAFNQDDIDTFNKLFEHGLTFDVRKVPGDSGENMQNILERAQNELNRNA